MSLYYIHFSEIVSVACKLIIGYGSHDASNIRRRSCLMVTDGWKVYQQGDVDTKQYHT